LDLAMAEIARAPLTLPQVRGEARRRVVRRFPNAVIYLVKPQPIEVLAVFHTSRDPKHWQARLGS
jgi:toxin ParE1/3/4